MMRVAVAAAAVTLVAVGSASAHIQVRPTSAAPDDPVLWTVLVPSERSPGTRQVELAIPKDVLPFSFEDTPGWTRTERKNPDGSLKSVVWRGRTKGDGLAMFRFLASTPEREGALRWAALQTYNDGKLVRWIGDEESEHPASVTQVTKSAPRENAGGESAAASDAQGSAPTTTAAAAASDDADGSEDDDDWAARGLAIAALLVAVGGAGLALRRRPRTGSA
jgi:uncharacterized protein YcnI